MVCDAAPHDHFVASPDGPVIMSELWASAVEPDPTIRAGIISSTSGGVAIVVVPPPDNHFNAGPDRTVEKLAKRRKAICACGRPTIATGTVLGSGVYNAAVISTIQDHFAPRPDCRVNYSRRGSAGSIGGHPGVGDGIVFPAGVQTCAAVISSPYDHLGASPDGRVTLPGCGPVRDW